MIKEGEKNPIKEDSAIQSTIIFDGREFIYTKLPPGIPKGAEVVFPKAANDGKPPRFAPYIPSGPRKK
jgi:hypothetical protein